MKNFNYYIHNIFTLLYTIFTQTVHSLYGIENVFKKNRTIVVKKGDINIYELIDVFSKNVQHNDFYFDAENSTCERYSMNKIPCYFNHIDREAYIEWINR